MAGTTATHHIGEVGLTVVRDSPRALLDIVFVHGLAGHPVDTWTCKRRVARRDSDIPIDISSKKRMPSMSPSPCRDDSSSVYWPKDLLPVTVPGSRVLTYGYDTRNDHSRQSLAPGSALYHISGELITALTTKRQAAPSRPILFVAHGVGGRVVKEMLYRLSMRYRSKEHPQDIFDSTIGIMFFGSPHVGIDQQDEIRRVVERISEATGSTVSRDIVRSLLLPGGGPGYLEAQFGPVAHKQKWSIYSFQELVGVEALNGDKVVEEGLSCLHLPEIETVDYVDRDHFNMCCFAGDDDTEYEIVAAALQKIVLTSSKVNDWKGCMEKEERRQKLIDSMTFAQINARHTQIRNTRFEWLSETGEYVNWLTTDRHRLWVIKGESGTGKSTVMKSAFDRTKEKKEVLSAFDRTKEKKEVLTIGYFINRTGDYLEKSIVGMCRSLLTQILRDDSSLQFLDRFESAEQESHGVWTAHTLKTLLTEAIQNLWSRSIICFVDGLDEFEEDEARDMIAFFELICDIASDFRICVSGRHSWPIVGQRWSTLILENQHGHDVDISIYLQWKLSVGSDVMGKTIRVVLQEKAQKIFLWAVLMVNVLNRERGRVGIDELPAIIHDCPQGTYALLRDTLTRGNENMEELLLCIQWILFSRQPLGPKQLYHAVVSGTSSEAPTTRYRHDASHSEYSQSIVDWSRGFAEVMSDSRVQLIHASIADFFLIEKGYQEAWPNLKDEFEGQSHEKLKECCVKYLKIDISLETDASSLPEVSSKSKNVAILRDSLKSKCPFSEYAVRNVLHHADTAQRSGISQIELVRGFPLSEWIYFHNLFEDDQSCHYAPGTSLREVLERGCFSHLSQLLPATVEGHRNFDDQLPTFKTLGIV
ncbi:hypothetical protein GGR53DRAFT_346380 [Hypoxylon sp. FL1150]|nr:hypothetical protein GGR53DRAFT_346380 [Hypoxylon sp. FL1150]